MKTTSQIIHQDFKLNGLRYESVDELLAIANELSKVGADFEVSIGKFIKKWLNHKDYISVRTSGSTGKSKKIKLKKAHMAQSAEATGEFFNMGANSSALLCLSAKYIGGKMMLVRAMTLGWDLHIVSPEKDALTQYDNDYDFVAMVPYQLYHSINALEKAKKIIVGGGAVSKKLEEMVADLSTEIYATYGMTETCSHVALRALNGPKKSDVYTAMRKIEFSVNGDNCLTINAPSISSEKVKTNDLVELISSSQFKWLGRYDNVINSGGIKINPEIVEEKLRSHIRIPFIVASEADEQLGERVILILENDGSNKLSNYTDAIQFLDLFERPKKIYTISKFPFTETGKIKRSGVLQLLREFNK